MVLPRETQPKEMTPKKKETHRPPSKVPRLAGRTEGNIVKDRPELETVISPDEEFREILTSPDEDFQKGGKTEQPDDAHDQTEDDIKRLEVRRQHGEVHYQLHWTKNGGEEGKKDKDDTGIEKPRRGERSQRRLITSGYPSERKPPDYINPAFPISCC